ncbi:hypothetical protein BKA70DRAFT_1448958 [Coprinopsis sp. MPI-PUGE-AT-0042]|nr:hypothetical protein BKA70DRAFT_1448958 [Coprinopsis sp. MPI-PUGE-AT-0042]
MNTRKSSQFILDNPNLIAFDDDLESYSPRSSLTPAGPQRLPEIPAVTALRRGALALGGSSGQPPPLYLQGCLARPSTPTTRPRASSLPPLTPESVVQSSPIKRAGPTDEANEEATLSLEETTDAVLKILDKNKHTIGDVMEFIFNPNNKRRQVQWDGFFHRHGRATRILDWWIGSSNSKTGREQVHEWAVDHVVRSAAKEAELVSKAGIFKSQSVADDAVMGFDFGTKY